MSPYLLIDVGNGRTKFGLATSDAILEQRDTPTSLLVADTARALATVLTGWTTASWSFPPSYPPPRSGSRHTLAARC
ncbi:hypothetical protein [Verrucomicrobium spinosum]|uniref:hypothetical protein n=1 Tax=Verrucomicrobium spinosum TaxID=2736 RepID=UPI000AF9BBC7|nr:hypothetical protein [Verrucomicrobium spinosum]